MYSFVCILVHKRVNQWIRKDGIEGKASFDLNLIELKNLS